MAKMSTIYFDLDGTLTNPKPGITRSIQYALARLDQAVPPEDELTWCIGPPLHASLKKLVGTDALADRALLLYRERFADIGLFENEAYHGIEETLSALAAPERRMFVATSKPAVYAERIIDHFGLRRYFERVFGSELDGTRVDKVELLRYALEDRKGRSDAGDHDRRPQPRYRRRAEQWHDRDRRTVWLWQRGRTEGCRRGSHLRDASEFARPLPADPGLIA